MVIKLLEIQPGATSIIASVEVDTGNTVVKAVAWNKEGYKEDAEGIDLTHLLSGLTELEDFSISAEELGVAQITGFYAIEFSSSASPLFRTDEPEEELPQTGIVANLLPYHECIINKSLAIVVKDCSVVKSKCGDMDTLLFASTLLDTANNTLLFGLYDEAIQILNTLDEVCEICVACPDYGTDLEHSGFGYKTVNNNLILA
jgi:hypothetical protein